jgi:hypothetical protein
VAAGGGAVLKTTFLKIETDDAIAGCGEMSDGPIGKNPLRIEHHPDTDALTRQWQRREMVMAATNRSPPICLERGYRNGSASRMIRFVVSKGARRVAHA